MTTVTLRLCGEHHKPIVYTDAGYFCHALSTLNRYDPDDFEDRGWCEACRKESEETAREVGGCMSFLPVQDVDAEDEWNDGTDLVMTPIGGVVDVIVCKCGVLPKQRRVQAQ